MYVGILVVTALQTTDRTTDNLASRHVQQAYSYTCMIEQVHLLMYLCIKKYTNLLQPDLLPQESPFDYLDKILKIQSSDPMKM